MLFETREQYLTEALALILDERIMPVVGDQYPRPAFRISVGFPKHSRSGKAIAVCFSTKVSTDKVNEIFINPEIDDPMQVLESVAHEGIHAVDDLASGHRNFFARVARGIGLEGPLTATVAGPELQTYLQTCIDLLGPYPHHRMSIDLTHKKGANKMLKLECADCGFIARTSIKWIAEMDTPAFCPVCANRALYHV